MAERILHVLNGLGTGGIEKYVIDLFKHIDPEKYVFDFLVRKEGDNHKDTIAKLGGKVYTVSPYPEKRRQNYDDVDAFFSLHKEYSVVHIHAPSLEYTNILKLAKKHNIKTIILHSHCSSRSTIKGKALHYFNRFATKNCPTDRLACSEKAAKWMFGNKDYFFAFNGIDTGKFYYNSERRESTRMELGLGDDFVWGHVGRLCKTKNQRYLLQLFKDQIDVNPNSRLIIVGTGSDMQMLQEYARELGIYEKVLFLGQRDDVHLLMCAMDVLVFPSLDEGLPLTVVEAQSVGLPCVISDVITQQVKITKQVSFLPLNGDRKKWIHTINEIGISENREDNSKIIKYAGFDISESSKRIELFYDEKYHLSNTNPPKDDRAYEYIDLMLKSLNGDEYDI